jgi:microsomal dipeptidase-like Zn-dependent dipeptidase
MRSGRWTIEADYGEGSADRPGWPEQPPWFQTPANVPNIAQGLRQRGMRDDDIVKVMGENWLRFLSEGLERER